MQEDSSKENNNTRLAHALANDKELIILSQIEDQRHVSQRELAQETGLSLGTVNLLLRKMIKQGLIKMETIPANRIVYMLTPDGIKEKTLKTVRYLKVHYNAIVSIKGKLLAGFDKLLDRYKAIYILRPEDELCDLLQQVIYEYHRRDPSASIKMIDDFEAIELDMASPGRFEKAAFLALPDDLLLEQAEKEYRKFLEPISLLVLL